MVGSPATTTSYCQEPLRELLDCILLSACEDPGFIGSGSLHSWEKTWKSRNLCKRRHSGMKANGNRS